MNLVIGYIFFSNPAMWIGALALGVPVVIHLLTRRTPRDIIFPTLRFIRLAKANQSSIHRIRHILLLIVRTALFLLILLAFLKPLFMRDTALLAKDEKTAKSAVIIVDASASMGYSGGAVTSFADAKVVALEILEHLRPGDQANLILMETTPRTSYDSLSGNLFLLRKDVRNARLTQEHADIDAALAEAVQQLNSDGRGRKEIYLISDFQRSNWASVDFGKVSPDIQLAFVEVGPDDAENSSIVDVALLPASPTVSETVEIVCKVANYSNRERRIPLQLKFQDGKVLTQEVALEPRTTTSVGFHVQIDKPGHYECRANIPQDGLEVDDRRFFTFAVADKINILLVTDEDPDDRKNAGRFLNRAVNPFLQDQHATAVASVIRSGQLDTLTLARAQVVIISGINELSPTTAKVLIDYMANGGSVAYFHVEGAAAHNLKLLEDISEGAYTAPYRITGYVDMSETGSHAALAQANFDHRVLRKFKDAEGLSDLKFYHFFSTERVKEKGQVLLRYDDRNIAMAEKAVGMGTLLLGNFSCSLQHSDLASHTTFVPLVHEIIKGLRPHAGSRNSFEVGDQCLIGSVKITQNDQVEFKNPAGDNINANMEIGINGATVFFPKTEKCGFYRTYVENEPVGSVAVNPNPLESNLATLDVSQLRELAKMHQSNLHTAGPGRAGIDGLLSGKPIWHYLLLGAIVLLALEQILVCIWKR